MRLCFTLSLTGHGDAQNHEKLSDAAAKRDTHDGEKRS
jgi:hypothetical protein